MDSLQAIAGFCKGLGSHAKYSTTTTGKSRVSYAGMQYICALWCLGPRKHSNMQGACGLGCHMQDDSNGKQREQQMRDSLISIISTPADDVFTMGSLRAQQLGCQCHLQRQQQDGPVCHAKLAPSAAAGACRAADACMLRFLHGANPALLTVHEPG